MQRLPTIVIVASALVIGVPVRQSAAQTPAPRLPGQGQKITTVGDDFEDPAWEYVYNSPKNSKELDGQARKPSGFAKNRRWFEGPLRGHPDVLVRVETPEGGLEGSTAALSMRSLYTGTPGRPSRRNQQDDLIVSVKSRLGGTISVSQCPNVVVRVYVPPLEEWEHRSGNHFGFRAGAHGMRPKDGEPAYEEYWPGMFLYLQRADRRRADAQDTATVRVRGRRNGADFTALAIDQTGWWTLGMSFTPEGQVHYYASPGVDDLVEEDRIASEYPYGFRCRQFETFFFDVISADNGRTWSTTWIIDDPTLYLARPRTSQPKQARPSRSGRPARR